MEQEGPKKKKKQKTNRKGQESKQKRPHPQSAECTMGSPKRRKHETQDLNPSPVA